VATDANRTAFAKAIMDVISQYGLDGVEFECALHSTFHIFSCSQVHSWESPGNQGIGCNVVSANDSANFLSFLQVFRGQDGAQNLTLSAAVGVTPFLDSTGTPMSDVSGFAGVLDYIGLLDLTALFFPLCLIAARRGHEL
jgi:chitinase